MNKLKEKKKIKQINIRDESKKKFYHLEYGINQRNATIERLESLIKICQELPTGAFEYSYYRINKFLEHFEEIILDLQQKNDNGWGGDTFKNDEETEEWVGY